MIDSKLNDILNSYDCDDSAYIISDYIKKNMKKIPALSIKKVAQDCYVSKGQISKFVRKLGYESYLDFKDACIDYLDAQERKPQIFSPDCPFRENVMRFSSRYVEMIKNLERKLDYDALDRLIFSISEHGGISLFAQGEARSICQILQIGLGNLGISIWINNSDYSRNFMNPAETMILIISINGRSFEYDKGVIWKILKKPNDTWLLTCNPDLEFPKNKLQIPSIDKDFNEFAVRFVIDLIIARLRELREKKETEPV